MDALQPQIRHHQSRRRTRHARKLKALGTMEFALTLWRQRNGPEHARLHRQTSRMKAGNGWDSSVGLRHLSSTQRRITCNCRIREVCQPGTMVDAAIFIYPMRNLPRMAQYGGSPMTRNQGYPCRVSLTNSNPGGGDSFWSTMSITLSFRPTGCALPSTCARATRPSSAFDTVPDQLRARMLAVRINFDTGAMMIGHALVDGKELEPAIERLFADVRAAYLYIHFASPGCYAPRASIARNCAGKRQRASGSAEAQRQRRSG